VLLKNQVDSPLLSPNCIYKYVNECCLKVIVLGLGRLFKLGFVTVFSVSSVERSTLENVINISCYFKRYLSLPSKKVSQQFICNPIMEDVHV